MTMNMRFFIIAAAATLLAACTQENEVQNNPVEARITAGVSGPKTRAVDNGWNADRIGVMVVDAPGTTTTMGGKYKNVGYATTSTGTNADFTPMTAGGGIFFEDAFLEFTFAAYAPYASGANASTLPGTDGKITVNTSNQPTTTEQEKVDYIHATGAKADKDSPTVSFTDNTASRTTPPRAAATAPSSTRWPVLSSRCRCRTPTVSTTLPCWNSPTTSWAAWFTRERSM